MYGKRNTLPERWHTPRFRKLSPHQKLTYLYILDVCDWAGFLEIDEERMSFDTRIPKNEISLILQCLDKEELVVNKEWLLVKDFIELQGNSPLSLNNNAHKNIIRKLRENIIHFEKCDRAKKNLAPYQPLVSPSSNSKANSKGQSNNNGSYKSETNPIATEINKVWNTDYKCHICGTAKGEKCQFKEECKFPERLFSI